MQMLASVLWARALLLLLVQWSQRSSMASAFQFHANENVPLLTNLFNAYEQVCEPLKTNTTDKVSPQSYIFCLPLITGVVTENNAWMSELYKGNLAMEPPPLPHDGGKVTVYLGSVAVQQYSIAETGRFASDLEVALSMTWIDSRLQWDSRVWPFRVFPAKLSVHHQVWAPVVMSPDRRDTLRTAKVSYNEATVRSNGNVTTSALIRVPTTKCSNDLHRYPYDRQRCCFRLIMEPLSHLRPVALITSLFSNAVDESSPSPWTLEDARLSVEKSSLTSEPVDEVLLCVTVLRNSAAIGAELSLPMAVSAVIFLCSQLIGIWSVQVYVKLAVLFVQLFAFQCLVSNTHLSVAAQLPLAYAFYNFTIALTVFNLLQTLLFWSLARRNMTTPPPHRLVLVGNLIAKWLRGALGSQGPKSGAAGELVQSDGGADSGGDWNRLFYTFHCLLSAITVIVYIFGLCVMYM